MPRPSLSFLPSKLWPARLGLALATLAASAGLLACAPSPSDLTRSLDLPTYAQGPLPPGLPSPSPRRPESEEALEGLRDAHYQAVRQRPDDPALRLRLVLLDLVIGSPHLALEDLRDAPDDPRFTYLRALAYLADARWQADPLDEEARLAGALDQLESLRLIRGYELPARYLRALIRCELGDFGPAELLVAEGRLGRADSNTLALAADNCGWGSTTGLHWRPRQAARLKTGNPARASALAQALPLNALWFVSSSLDSAWAVACAGRTAARDSILASVEMQAAHLPGDGRLAKSPLAESRNIRSCSPERLRKIQPVLEALAAAGSGGGSSGGRKGMLQATAGLPQRAVALGLDRQAAWLRWGRAYALSSEGHPDAAIAELRSMRAIARGIQDVALQWTAANELRVRLADAGRIEESLEPLSELRAFAQSLALDPATFGVSEGFYHHQIADQQGAFQAWAGACRVARRLHQELAEMRARESLAFHALVTRDSTRARRYAEQVIESPGRSPLERLRAEIRHTVCHAKVDLGHAVALDPKGDLTILEAAIRECAQSEYHRAAIEGRLVLARALAKRGRLDAAGAAARAGEAAAGSHARDMLPLAVAVQGQILLQAGDLAGAARQFEQALREVEQTHAGLSEAEARASFLLSARGLVDTYIDVLLRLPGGIARAWCADERGRQHWIGALGGSTVPPWASRYELGDELRAVQRRLPRHGVMLKYRVQPERSLVWIVTSDSVQLKYTPISETELAGEVEEWRQSILDGIASRRAESLYTLLLAPAERVLAENAPLILVPDGPLVRAPLHLTQRGDSCLLALHPVNYAVSGRTWAHLQDRADALGTGHPRPRHFLGVGYGAASGVGASIRSAEQEVAQIGALPGWANSIVLVGAEATPEAARRALPGRTVVHFACHVGVDPLGRPALYLAPSPAAAGGTSGLLTAAELSGWPLASVDLVVLSACESATTPAARSLPALAAATAFSPLGGVHGLGAAAFVGGAGAVIASLWSVEDDPTQQLMVSMYSELFSHARTPAEALRAAQLGWASGPGATRHERAWAAFCVYGP